MAGSLSKRDLRDRLSQLKADVRALEEAHRIEMRAVWAEIEEDEADLRAIGSMTFLQGSLRLAILTQANRLAALLTRFGRR